MLLIMTQKKKHKQHFSVADINIRRFCTLKKEKIQERHFQFSSFVGKKNRKTLQGIKRQHVKAVEKKKLAHSFLFSLFIRDFPP